MHLCQRFFQSSKHFWNALLGIALSSSSDAALISSIVANRRPFIGLFNLGKRKKSQGAKSGEYGGWGMMIVLFLAKKLLTSNDVCAGALSWCRIHECSFHTSGRFFLIDSRKRIDSFDDFSTQFLSLPEHFRRFLTCWGVQSEVHR